MSSWLKKVAHAVVPAAGAAVAAALTVVGMPVSAVLKVAGGAFVAYLIKPARPAEPPKP